MIKYQPALHYGDTVVPVRGKYGAVLFDTYQEAQGYGASMVAKVPNCEAFSIEPVDVPNEG